jgi:hypothetical protein
MRRVLEFASVIPSNGASSELARGAAFFVLFMSSVLRLT